MVRKRSLALFASLLVYVAVIAVPARADAQVSPTACGPNIAKSTGGYWTCTFADDFNGSTLDRTNWSVLTTETSGFSHAFECYIDDPSTVSVATGSLRLTARRVAVPQWCGSRFVTHYQSGMVHTMDTFAQAYGRFEARIRFPRGRGFHSAWWMWPRDMAYGTRSGEIDVAEHFGAYPSVVSPYVHIKDGGTERGKGAYCTVWGNESGFHKYAVEWTPLGFKVLYDGRTCMTFASWDPGESLTYPQPFDQPFFLMLTLALQGYGPNAVTSGTPFPATMYVDYVRGWS
jgi:beta-glucanase (GH16 family)